MYLYSLQIKGDSQKKNYDVNWLNKHIPAAMNTDNRRIVGCIIFYVVHDLSKDSL
jgi:hypothetical protein